MLIFYSTQIEVFVNGLFALNSDASRFKLHLRDFLIQLKEFSGEDNADLFLEEKEKEIEAQRAAEREKALRLPGLLKPSEQTMDDDDDL